MKKINFLFILLISVSYCYSQTKAVTDTGKEVILYDDGTWKYANEEKPAESKIKTNPTKFEKNKTATFLVKSTKFPVGVWMNSQKWTFKKGDSEGDAEYEFQSKGNDIYGMLISEKIEIPIETLKNIALENAKSVAPDIKIISQEMRSVNGIQVLCMQMNGTIEGVKFTYYGYYYSNSNGTAQFVTYTSQSLFSTYKKDMEELLNGFVKLK